MYRLIIIQFLRNKIALTALLFLLAAGIISLLVGKKFLAQQQRDVQETVAYQEQHIARLVKYDSKEMGSLLYYLKFAYINPTAPMAGLAIGQRDINSSIQNPTIRAIEAQRYDTDIRNPYLSMLGNFDLNFVIIYLFPLVIIACCFNLYSEEKEQGAWPLIMSQGISTRKYLLLKISVPYLFTSLLLLLLCLFSVWVLQIPLEKSLATFTLSNWLYISFWFAVNLFVVSFFKNSSTNAIILLSIWLLLTLLLPAAINNHITRQYPVPESLSSMLKQRDGYHKKWDIPMDSTLNQFFKEYPQYASYKWNKDSYNWLWYYAMQHLGDAEAHRDSELFINKLHEREQLSKTISRMVPTLYTQLQNIELAQTSLANHLQFLDSTTHFHERLRKYFYPKIFTSAPVLKENWAGFVPEYCHIPYKASILQSAYLLLFVLLIGAMAIARLQQKNIQR